MSEKELSADEEVREIYNLRRKTLEGYISEKNTAIVKARQEERERAEAEKKVLAEKIQQEKIDSAKKMLRKGLGVADISDFTGLPIEELQKLR